MANQIKLLTFLVFLLFISGVYSKEKQEQGKELNDTARSYKVVKQRIEKVFPAIKEALAEVDTIYKQRKTIFLKFYITPGGALDLVGFVDSVMLDSVAMKDLTESLNMQIFDPVDKKTFTKVIVRSYLDKNKAVALSGKIEVDYIEIRSRDGILLVIDINRRSLRRAYSKRWAKNRDLKGRIVVRFGIDENGNVVFCKVIESSMNDSVFEQTIVKNVTGWKFGKINNPGDVTEVVYPFTFSQ